MLKILSTLPAQESSDVSLTLPFSSRQKSRFKAQLDNGTEVGIFLERGKILRHGDLLHAENGLVIKLIAADEKVSCITCSKPLQLTKLCYHLGNRHVSLQIESDKICYLQDTVLDDMVTGLGGKISHCLRPFEPEEGAYHAAHKHES